MKVRRDGHGWVSAAVAACLMLASATVGRAEGKLEFKYPEGKALEYKSTANVFQVLNLMGMEIQSSEKRTMTWSVTGGKRRGDGSQPLAVKTLSLRSEMKLQGGIELSFDSSKHDSFSGDQNFAALGDVYRLQSDLAYTLVLDEHGTPKAVEELDAIRDKAGKLDPISQEMVRGQIDPDKIKIQFEQDQHFLPDHPVRPGDTWERNEVLDSRGGMMLTVRKKYEYVGNEKKDDKTVEKITCKTLDVKHEPDPSSKLPLKVIKSDLKVESSQGTILFHRESGCLLESQERTKIKGNVTLSGGGMDLPSELSLNLQSEKKLQTAQAKKPG
jgi:hypothetical protein